MGDAGAEWQRLHEFPNAHSARSVPQFDVTELTESEFGRAFLNTTRPCLVKNAARHWPAFQKWNDIEYLKRHAGAVRVKATRDLLGKLDRPLWEMSLAEFLDVLSATEQGYLCSQGEIRPPRGGTLDAAQRLRDDLGTYTFNREMPPPRFFPPASLFIYKRSYTDWHSHPGDETFMTQIVGSKWTFLLPPDDETWDTVSQVFDAERYLGPEGSAAYKPLAHVQPYRVLVEAGDALYIPPFWWHAVESCDDKFGFTVATSFKSPLHVQGDLRYPACRMLVRERRFSRRGPATLAMLAGSALSRLHRRWTGA